MVIVEDKTKESLREQIKSLKSEKLILKWFGEFLTTKQGICNFINLYLGVNDIGYFCPGNNSVRILDQRFENAFRAFGKIYERIFEVENFKVETDYSKSP